MIDPVNIALRMVTIPKAEYDALLYKERKLRALEAAGVDNWEWYGDAMESLKEEEC